jgi:hypothetical protein
MSDMTPEAEHAALKAAITTVFAEVHTQHLCADVPSVTPETAVQLVLDRLARQGRSVCQTLTQGGTYGLEILVGDVREAVYRACLEQLQSDTVD